MALLLDTNILVRLANQTDAANPTAEAAVIELHRRGETLYITGQNLVEFRNVATRPVAVNGLGLTATAAAAFAALFETTFPLLEETPAVYPAWRTLADTSGVLGKQVHDARLVAVCQVHGVTGVLTFNTRHFLRYTAIVPGFAALDPATV